jgi:phospholipid/cholesterol/gamma-HCH transport system substrate-binding protein
LSDIKKSSNQSITAILVAIFMTIALVLAWWGFCWYKNTSLIGGGNIQRLKVMFKNANALNENTYVCTDGIKTGVVDKIEWLGSQQILVYLRINDKVKIYEGAKFKILTNGLVGAKYIEITTPSDSQVTDSNASLLDDSRIIIGEESGSIEKAIDNLAGFIDSFDADEFKSQWRNDRKTILRAANRVSVLADRAIPVAERALPLENEAFALSKAIRKTTRRLDNLLGNENLSADLKETAQKAKETAEHIQSAIHELNTTVTDKDFRRDILTTFSNLNDATLHIENSMYVLDRVGNNQALRSDVKEILYDARKAMDRFDEILSKPRSENDMRSALGQTREAIVRINLAAQQINQILDKRHPLLHLLIGRPGHVKTEKIEYTDISR